MAGGLICCFAQPAEDELADVVTMPADPKEYAVQLYGILRLLDARGLDWIAVETPPDLPEWEAVRDRLRRAAGQG